MVKPAGEKIVLAAGHLARYLALNENCSPRTELDRCDHETVMWYPL